MLPYNSFNGVHWFEVGIGSTTTRICRRHFPSLHCKLTVNVRLGGLVVECMKVIHVQITRRTLNMIQRDHQRIRIMDHQL